MCDPQVAPALLEILQHQAAVTPFGRRLATEQDRGDVEQVAIKPLLDTPLAHQIEETALVLLPAALLLAVCVEQRLCRRQQRLVEVLRAAELAQEVGEVLALGKARELRDVVEPDV